MKKTIFNIIKIIFIVLSIILTIYLMNKVISLDMIPNKYLRICIIIEIIINILVVLCYITKNKVLNILGIILSILIISLSIFGIKHITTIFNILDKAFNNHKIEITNYSVVVLNDSNYKKIDDLSGKIVGYAVSDIENDEYMKEFKKNESIEFKLYNNSYTLYLDLLNKKVDAAVFNDVYIDFLKDEQKDFDEKTNIISNMESIQDVKPIDTNPIDDNKEDNNKEQEKIKDNKENEKKEETKNEEEQIEPFNIVISGSDSRTSNLSSKIRSDVNMVVTVNPKNRKILLTSLPRDTYVQIYGTTGYKDKLTHTGIYGLYTTKATIQNLLKIKINYSVKVGFSYTIKLINLIGGVDIYSDKSFTTYSYDGGAQRVYIKAGMNHLNGAQALSYARERYAYSDGDFHRIKNQQDIIESIMNKLFSNKDLLSNYEEILNSLTSLYVTDIPNDLIKKLVKFQLENPKSWKIEKQSLKATGYTTQETYTFPGLDQFVAIPVESSISSCSSRINSLMKAN